MVQKLLNGMIIIRKEPGYTSNDVVAKLRGILHMKKIGHTGTLDPDAEGVLPVCLGNATKLVDLIADRDKEYVAVMKLGVTTDTGDLSGNSSVLTEVAETVIKSEISESEVRDVCQSFVGEYDQIPPMYSALKVNGRKLCDLARSGVTVERKARRVHIYELEVRSVELPFITISVRCSKGTYIRTLCEDIGNQLCVTDVPAGGNADTAVGAAMQHLTRTRVGQFRLENALTLGEVEELMSSGNDSYERIRSHILPVENFFSDCPGIMTKPETDSRLLNGNTLIAEDLAEDTVKKSGGNKMFCRDETDGNKPVRYRAFDSTGQFRAVYLYDSSDGIYRSEKMFL